MCVWLCTGLAVIRNCYSLYMKTSKTFTFGKHCPLDFLLPLCFSPHVPISSKSAEVSGSNCLARVFFGVCHTGALRADAVLACHLLTLLRIPGTLGSGWLSEACGFCGSRNNAGHYKPGSDRLELTLLLWGVNGCPVCGPTALPKQHFKIRAQTY